MITFFFVFTCILRVWYYKKIILVSVCASHYIKKLVPPTVIHIQQTRLRTTQTSIENVWAVWFHLLLTSYYFTAVAVSAQLLPVVSPRNYPIISCALNCLLIDIVHVSVCSLSVSPLRLYVSVFSSVPRLQKARKLRNVYIWSAVIDHVLVLHSPGVTGSPQHSSCASQDIFIRSCKQCLQKQAQQCHYISRRDSTTQAYAATQTYDC